MDERRQYWSERMRIENQNDHPRGGRLFTSLRKKNYSQKKFFPMAALDFLYLY
jgi:hypothetical protein